VSALPADLNDALAQLAGRRPLLLASDYDGVLAPLVDDPSAAVPLDGIADVLARLAAVPGVTVALGDELAHRRDALRDQLFPVVAGTAGARLEVKPASVAVHVRQVTDRSAATALLEHVATIVDPSLTKKPGKDVLELAVTDADKGSALRRLRADLSAAGAMYLGDDRTDEDGFRALEPDDVTVKIGEGETVARFRVADPHGALALLEKLAALLR
jgi:trehalose 6-phosphate phosphatase